ncbi:MAG TPA: hypothetical protein VGR21_10190 [Cryptosporangiaceae bacterium]|nr:hypothetical protein [Cryptosporangiaceae bacterium]
MTNQRNRRLDRATAEQLLRGDPADAGVDAERLQLLLSAAAGPPRHHELAGERTAVAAFRRAQVSPSVATHRRPRTLFGRLVRVKLAAAAAVAAMGGVAFAASTGALPGPVQDAAHGVFGAPSAHSGAAASPAASPRVSALPSPVSPSRKPSVAPPPAPSPSLVGLCRAYQARPEAAQSKALDQPAFAALVAAAKGKEHVADYCTALLASPKAPPGKPDRPPPRSENTPGDSPSPASTPGPPDDGPDQ